MIRILIAEDEQRIASFIDKGLSAAGFTTTVVADGASAYEYARGSQFDLMILDLGLPVRDGLTVLRQLRADDVHIPVIVLTARDAVNDRVAALEGGADDYMAKPFAFAELLARVRLRLRTPGQAEPTVLRYGTLADVKTLDNRKPDQIDKDAVDNGSYVVIRQDDGQERLYHLAYLRADNGLAEIMAALDKS